MEKIAKVYSTTGEVWDLDIEEWSENGKLPYEVMRAIVGGIVEMVPLPNGDTIIIHEEGKLIGLPKNEEATMQWKLHYPKEHYEINNDELIVGNAIIVSSNYLE